ncbi:MAG: mechanosensitive ion channel [Pyrinomonadaceae bacterium]|nr:mechanosensitive ion channel [Pyrinomonadaceae bacterium]
MIRSKLPELGRQVEEREAEIAARLGERLTLRDIRVLEKNWKTLGDEIPDWKIELRARIDAQDKNAAEFDKLEDTWNRTLAGITGNLPASNSQVSITPAPAEVVEKVKATIDVIRTTRREVDGQLASLLALRTQVSDLEARISKPLDEIAAIHTSIIDNLFQQDREPLWSADESAISGHSIAGRVRESLSTQLEEFRLYTREQSSRLVFQALVFLMITATLYWAGGRFQVDEVESSATSATREVLRSPVLSSVIITILLSDWIYPSAPKLLRTINGALILVPVVVLARRLVDRKLFAILNLLVAFYILDEVRELLSVQPLTARIVLLLEMLTAIGFLAWFIRGNPGSDDVNGRHKGLLSFIRKAAPFLVAIFTTTFIAAVLGFMNLANVLADGLLGSTYAAMFLYVAAEIARGIVAFILRSPSLANIGLIANNRDLILSKAGKAIKWVAIYFWLVNTLQLLSLQQSVRDAIHGIVSWSFSIDNLEISIGDLVLVVATLWIASLLSRFLQFLLAEYIYPNVDLGSGVSYTVSTLLHYVVLTIGFLIALAELGVDLTKFAIVAGALGVGIGFGLQNIINNFVSGLILLFERPIKVGDTVQLENHVGSLRRIGLRASVLQKDDGSDVIVPNSHLISEDVIDLSRSFDRKKIEIEVGVALDSDPEMIIQLLRDAPSGRNDLLPFPAPMALLSSIGEETLDFKLLVWTKDPLQIGPIKSEISSAVFKALKAANIEIPFPQRNLYLHYGESTENGRDAGREKIRKSTD